jgi:putative tryptophan/tyrosine transport system substrate-binding protein
MLVLSRRQFVAGAGVASLGLLAGCGRLPGQGRPPPPKVPTIGYLVPGLPDSTIDGQLDAFRDGLAALGYAEGQNVAIERRYTDGSDAQLREAATDLVRHEVDVLVVRGTAGVLAAKGATNTTPIVFANAGDPVASGLVASLARPGGNATGLSNIVPQLSGKRLELLGRVVPGLQRVAFLWDPRSSASSVSEMQAASTVLGLRLQVLEIRDAADLEVAFAAADAEQADALMVGGGSSSRNGARIVSLAASRRLPAMYQWAQAVHEGGLMSYGVNELDAFRRAATYVDKILKGAQSAELPIEQPMRFDFIVNLKTAQALGITFPNEIMLQVTEVVQ